MYKIKLYGFPASGKTTHIEKWLKDENIDVSVINNSLLAGADLTKPLLDRQKLALKRFQVCASDESNVKLTLDHSPIEMVEWFTLYHHKVSPFPEDELKQMMETIESIKSEEKQMYEKVFHVYFMANRKILQRNMRHRDRLNEYFDEECCNFISDKMIFHFARTRSDGQSVFEIRCRKNSYREDVFDNILKQIDQNQMCKFSPEDFA